jgi:hypothetical protein
MNEDGIVTLRGGARITLRGYLPDKTCHACGKVFPAPVYLKTWTFIDGVRTLKFGNTCRTCAPPPRDFPGDLRGMRLVSPYIDDDGQECGWFQRNRFGIFGEELPLERIGWRLEKGVYRPQPKLDRRSERQVLEVS